MNIGKKEKRGKNPKRIVIPVQVPEKVPERVKIPVEVPARPGQNAS